MLSKQAVIVMFLILAVEAQCGIIDNIYGRVKNTTTGLKQDVKNVWTYSKATIGLESATEDNRPEEEKRGFIGGMLHSTREKVHSFRNYFWNTDEISDDAGVFGNMYNRVKKRLSKMKGSMLNGNQINHQTTQPRDENTKVVSDILNKLFFGNGTRKIHGDAFEKVVEDLRKKLHYVRNNLTGITTESPVHYGEGLIDVRTAVGNVRESISENVAGLNNDIYDEVDDSFVRVKDKTAKSFDNVKKNVNKGVNTLREGVQNAANQLDEFRDDVPDATARENELLKNSFRNVNAKNVGENVKNMLDDERLSF